MVPVNSDQRITCEKDSLPEPPDSVHFCDIADQIRPVLWLCEVERDKDDGHAAVLNVQGRSREGHLNGHVEATTCEAVAAHTQVFIPGREKYFGIGSHHGKRYVHD